MYVNKLWIVAAPSIGVLQFENGYQALLLCNVVKLENGTLLKKRSVTNNYMGANLPNKLPQTTLHFSENWNAWYYNKRSFVI